MAKIESACAVLERPAISDTIVTDSLAEHYLVAIDRSDLSPERTASGCSRADVHRLQDMPSDAPHGWKSVEKTIAVIVKSKR